MGYLFSPVVKKIPFHLQNSSKAFISVHLMSSNRYISALNSSLEKNQSPEALIQKLSHPFPVAGWLELTLFTWARYIAPAKSVSMRVEVHT